MIGTVNEIIEDMKSGVYNFTDNGECSNCGACCSDLLPISELDINKIKKYLKSHNIKEQRNNVAMAELDLTCPFRSEKDRKCLIYEVRPLICRDFKCDNPAKDIQATKDLYNGKYNPVSMRNVFFGGMSLYEMINKIK